jgi:hypothetical protein
MTSLSGALKTVKWAERRGRWSLSSLKDRVFNSNKEPSLRGIKLNYYYNFIHHKLLVFLLIITNITYFIILNVFMYVS